MAHHSPGIRAGRLIGAFAKYNQTFSCDVTEFFPFQRHKKVDKVNTRYQVVISVKSDDPCLS